ncbi:MAG: response regulator transcription factor [Cryomorphaceae bacterium]|nr:response regulator transcription factor [Cryomorphaceae bacterium]
MNALIIEDEEVASERLSLLIHRYDPSIDIVGVLDSVKSAVQWFKENPMPDLVFLDIHLGDGLSFQIFEEIPQTPPIIFTTAFDEYAVKAFKLRSIDYLLKPVRSDELQAAMEKFKSWRGTGQTPGIPISELRSLLQGQMPSYKSRFSVVVGQKIKTIEIADIAYFRAQGNNTFLVTHTKNEYAVDFTLDQLSGMLDPKLFFRLNRQFLSQISAIEQVLVYPKSKLKIQLKPKSDLEVMVSSERSASFKRWLDGEV